MLKGEQNEYNTLKSASKELDNKILNFSAVGLKLNSLNKKKVSSKRDMLSFDSSKTQINKETKLMDSLISQTRDVFKDNYSVNLSFSGSKEKEESQAAQLKAWEDKYTEFESLVNDLKKKIGYPETSNFGGEDDEENPLIKLIEEVQNMVEFMESKGLDIAPPKPTPTPIDETEPIPNNNPIIIGALLLGGYLIFK